MSTHRNLLSHYMKTWSDRILGQRTNAGLHILATWWGLWLCFQLSLLLPCLYLGRIMPCWIAVLHYACPSVSEYLQVNFGHHTPLLSPCLFLSPLTRPQSGWLADKEIIVNVWRVIAKIVFLFMLTPFCTFILVSESARLSVSLSLWVLLLCPLSSRQ